MAIIKKLMGRLKSLGRADSVIEHDLQRLNSVQPAMGDLAASYVRDGSNETVLSTLSTVGDNGLLKVCYGYVPYQDTITPERYRFFVLSAESEPHLLCRYVEVLNAVTAEVPNHAMGSKHVPDKLRIFFTELFNGDAEINRQSNQNQKCHLTLNPEEALKYCQAFDGSWADFFDVLYQTSNHYYRSDTALYRERFQLKDHAIANSQALFVAGKRISAQGKRAIADDIVKWGLVESPEFLQFLLSLAGESAKEPRNAALNALKTVSPTVIEPLAIEQLEKGSVAVRAGMIELLTTLGTSSALDAMVAHKNTEKTARIIAAIDNGVLAQTSNESAIGTDSAESYQAINNQAIVIPPLREFASGESPEFGAADQARLRELFEKENEKIRQQNEVAKKEKYKYKRDLHKLGAIDEILDFFNGKQGLMNTQARRKMTNYLSYGPARPWANEAFHRLPQDQAVRLCVQLGGTRGIYNYYYSEGGYVDYLREYLGTEQGDYRQLEALEIELGLTYEKGPWGKRVEKPVEPGDLGRAYLSHYYGVDGNSDEGFKQSLWPYVASHLDILDEALGLAAKQSGKDYHLPRALELIAMLPATPLRYLGPLLEMATGAKKQGRAEAKQMLAGVADVNDRLLVLLSDSRQDIRAGAAKWVSERGFDAAIPTIKKQLKKEKSPLAKAALLTTLRQLGENLDDYIGPEALLQEAETGLKKAKLDALSWLPVSHASKIRYRNGDGVPETVIQWWCFLAVKLKQPGGNGLFELYQEQLQPGDAEAFSSWILDSWIQFDTARAGQAEAQAYAKANAKQRFSYYSKWDRNYTEEAAFQDLQREFMSNYLNSGAATKGLLAFARYAPPTEAADKVRAFLKNHGSRTSQSSALLEMLAAKGDAVSLQVVIAAATRLKQKGVQKLAGELLQGVAERKNWTLDELADRTVPSAGMDESGIIELICTDQQKRYQAYLDDSLTVVIQNPDGKTVKGLPSGTDDNTKAAKKQLSATKKEVKQAVSMQGSRLYEALCSERHWNTGEWLENYQQHPLMRKLIERLVWLGLNEAGEVIDAFRPTAEGDYTDAGDNDVDLENFAQIRLAHGVLMNNEQVEQWQEHLADYEVTPLFKQFGRPLLTIDDADSKQMAIDERKGYVTNTFALRGNATKLGYERGAAEDGGVFWEYTKTFRSTGLVAVVDFSGNCLPEENLPAALTTLSFVKFQNNTRRHQKVKLTDVPPVLLSECWNDYHEMVAKAVYDKDWEKKMPWM